ncbi:MAG: RnfABCDGE type electron transport complex subunit B [Clostridia bacterium]|nr:RnfABCDGE type electron transport complex subunit B [Clostridia bacterium]MDE7306900.1 RnfABCDGE type electron transport complex subunit B [Clostridia bacterium]
MNLLEIGLGTLKTVGIVAGIFAGTALIIGALILIVSKVFKVDVDEKITKILENLAGANCGGCGCSGCSGFASKLADGSGNLNDCHVTSPEKKAEIAKLLGIELSDEERTVAVVKCNGGEKNAADKFEYKGNPTCAANNSLLGGNKMCSYACLGCGDCKAVCPENAIEVTARLAQVDPDRCISCGACISTCPKSIIERIPASAPVYVACSSKCKGKEVMSVCKVGCIACGICAKSCPHGAITMQDNLPIIDYKKCTGCLTCVAKCPRHIIISRKVIAEETPAQTNEARAQ